MIEVLAQTTSALETGGVVAVAIGVVEIAKMAIGKLGNGKGNVEQALYHDKVDRVLSSIERSASAIEKSCEKQERIMDDFLRNGCPNAGKVLELMQRKDG